MAGVRFEAVWSLSVVRWAVRHGEVNDSWLTQMPARKAHKVIAPNSH